MNIEFKASASKSLKGVSPQLTKLLKEDARRAEWPNDIITKLKVAIEELNIVIYYPEKFATKVEDLEYGNQNDSPQSIFRLFITKHSDAISSSISDWSVDYLIGQDLIP
jgi:hypothetical protein